MEDLVPNAGYAVITDAVRQKLSLTETALRATMKDEDRASSLLTTGAAYMTDTQRTKVRDILNKASSNIIIYADISRYCYQNLNENCLTFASTREASLQAYAPGDLDLKRRVPGDADENGCVNDADYTILQNSYGKSTNSGGADAPADFNHDAWVDYFDYLIMTQHWNRRLLV